MYISHWFWDSRLNWHPKSKSWSHPDAKIGYIARGLEGGISASSSDSQVDSSSGGAWAWTSQWGLPKDDPRADGRTTSTVFTGHSQYTEPTTSSSMNWLGEVLEPVLAGTAASGATPADIVAKGTAAQVLPECNDPDGADLEIVVEDEERNTKYSGFGATAEVATAQEKAERGCPMRYALDSDKMDCSGETCLAPRYLTLRNVALSDDAPPPAELEEELLLSATMEADVPEAARDDLRDNSAFPAPGARTRRSATGEYFEPAEPESSCFESPGPADPRLFCVRTATKSWIGFKW